MFQGERKRDKKQMNLYNIPKIPVAAQILASVHKKRIPGRQRLPTDQPQRVPLTKSNFKPWEELAVTNCLKPFTREVDHQQFFTPEFENLSDTQ